MLTEQSKANLLFKGLQLVELTRHRDGRGVLVAFENGTNLPFAMQRFFVLSEMLPGTIRAEHCSSAEELLVVLAGGVVCDADNGEAEATVTLLAGGPGLWVRPGVWIRLRDFLPGTVVGVAVSLSYADTRQQPTPNRQWLAAALAAEVPA